MRALIESLLSLKKSKLLQLLDSAEEEVSNIPEHLNESACSSKVGNDTVSVYVLVQFYPWFKFSFLLFLDMVLYDNNMIMSLKQNKRKFEPRIKLNHNIYS